MKKMIIDVNLAHKGTLVYALLMNENVILVVFIFRGGVRTIKNKCFLIVMALSLSSDSTFATWQVKFDDIFSGAYHRVDKCRGWP